MLQRGTCRFSYQPPCLTCAARISLAHLQHQAGQSRCVEARGWGLHEMPPGNGMAERQEFPLSIWPANSTVGQQHLARSALAASPPRVAQAHQHRHERRMAAACQPREPGTSQAPCNVVVWPFSSCVQIVNSDNRWNISHPWLVWQYVVRMRSKRWRPLPDVLQAVVRKQPGTALPWLGCCRRPPVAQRPKTVSRRGKPWQSRSATW